MRDSKTSDADKKTILEEFFSLNSKVKVEVPRKGSIPVSEMTMDVRANFCMLNCSSNHFGLCLLGVKVLFSIDGIVIR